MKTHPLTAALTLAATLVAASSTRAADANNWQDHAISPVANPLFFESPLIQSELRPIYAYHNIDDKFVGGFVRYYAAQLRVALTDRLALIATKDGYLQIRADAPGLTKKDGWADIGAGLKYALVDDRENAFILTPGIKFELPTGNERVFQGNGKGEFNVFVSAMKGWGDFHLTGSAGARIPVDFDAETASVHYSLQADYYTCQWFIPFVALNGFTTLSEAKALPFNIEGFDVINFGSTDASGFTQITFAAGFRSRLCKWADVGASYEKSITTPRGLFDDRYTVDMIFRF